MKEQNLAAVIDLGSNSLRLKICENTKGTVKMIEELRYPLSIGRDTFANQKISFEKIDTLCEIIRNFLDVALSYGIEDVKAVGTSALREAENKAFVLDQIKIRTGLAVRVIDELVEKTYIYKEMCRKLSTTKSYKNSAMMVFIGSGSLGVSLYEKGSISFNQNIKIGSLRLSEMFYEVQEYTGEFHLIVEEYVKSFTKMFRGLLPTIQIKHFLASGREINTISDICKAEKDAVYEYISKEKFLSVYDEIKFKTVDEIIKDYNLPEDKAEVLLSAMCIYRELFNFTEADRIVNPNVNLADGLLHEMLCKEEEAYWNKIFYTNTLLCAMTIAERYKVDMEHVQRVEKYALKIFDAMKKRHGMGNREKLLLQASVILHDTGKYINIKNNGENTLYIVKTSDIIGIDQRETELIANIASYHEEIPLTSHSSYSALAEPDKVLTSKLAAILNLAHTLDEGNAKKFDGIDVKIKDGNLIVSFSTNSNTLIEEWTFRGQAHFFRDVFGIYPILKKKKVF